MEDKEMIEYLHRSGKLPDWMYYQLNGKTATENYNEQRQKFYNKIQADKELNEYKARRKAEIDLEIESQIETEITPKIEKALDDLLKDFQ